MAKPFNGLRESISQKLIPWVESGQTNLMVMPYAGSDLPADIQLQYKPITGPRRKVKNRRPANQMSSITALWPDESLCAKNEPFLLWVLTGRAQMQIGSQLISCGEATGVLIPVGLPHPDGSQNHAEGANSSCSILWIRQCGRGLRCWISHSHDGRNLRPRPGESMYFPQEQIVHVFSVLCDELQNRRQEKTCEHALMLFLLLVQQELASERAFNVATYNAAREVEEWHQVSEQDPLELACLYIQSHLSDPITLESVARVVHMSRANFARRFHEHTGQTFLQFVQKHRLEQAQTFLRETDWTVRTISELCGFASYSSFNTFFSQRMNTTPARYRKLHRETIPKHRDESATL